MKDTERGKRRSRLPVGSLRCDSIPGPQNYNLSRRQTLNHGATHVLFIPVICNQNLPPPGKGIALPRIAA